MVKIQTAFDITCSNISDSIKEYLLKYTQSILMENQVNSLSKIGCIYFLKIRWTFKIIRHSDYVAASEYTI